MFEAREIGHIPPETEADFFAKLAEAVMEEEVSAPELLAQLLATGAPYMFADQTTIPSGAFRITTSANGREVVRTGPYKFGGALGLKFGLANRVQRSGDIAIVPYIHFREPGTLPDDLSKSAQANGILGVRLSILNFDQIDTLSDLLGDVPLNPFAKPASFERLEKI